MFKVTILNSIKIKTIEFWNLKDIPMMLIKICVLFQNGTFVSLHLFLFYQFTLHAATNGNALIKPKHKKGKIKESNV